MFENDDAYGGWQPDPAPAPEPEARERPVEADPETASAPEPAQAADKPKPEPRSKRKPAAVNKSMVRQVRDTLDLLADERTRAIVAALANRDGGDVDALAVAVINGVTRAPARLLVELHDEPSGVKRAIRLVGEQEKDAALVRALARIAVVLDPALADRLKKNGGMTIAEVVAESAADLDVTPVRGLA